MLYENCSIDILLNAEYSKNNIYKVLQKGQQKDFIYRDQNTTYALIEDAYQAAEIIMKAHTEQSGIGPGVFVTLSGYSNVTLWFYKEKNNFLSLRISVFGEPKLKDDLIDLGYYVPFFLELCQDFSILSIETKLYND